MTIHAHSTNPVPAILPFGAVIAAVLPRLCELAAAIERTLNPIALAAAIFVRGRTILNLSPAQVITAGKCFSFLRALVQDANQTASCVFHTFSLAPVLSLSVSHAHKKAWRRKHGVQRNSAAGA